MSELTKTKTAEDLQFGHYLRTGMRLTGDAAEAFLETKAREDRRTVEPKSAEAVLFGHYLRTGEHLHGAAAARFLELKFNQRHYRENGQFARAGEGSQYGSGVSEAGQAARSSQTRGPAANSRNARLLGTANETSQPSRDILVIGDKDQQLRDDFDATFGTGASGRRNGEQRQEIPAIPMHPPNRSYRLGTLSKQHESGNSGPETVSNGIGDAGGVSYGLY